MNKDIFSKGKTKQSKGEKKITGKTTNDKSQPGIPKVCPSCQNPRWDKTPRKS